jgi:hypothetical protein
MPPWKAAGTRVSNAPVSAAGSVSVRRPAVPLMSRLGSSAPSTSESDGAPSIASHTARRGHKADELPLTGEFDFVVSSNYDSWVAQPLVLEHH